MTQSPTIEENTVVKQVEGLLSANVDADLVLMSIENGKFYGLDDIGRRVWELLSEPQSLGRLCEILMAEYNVDRQSCERDVSELVGKLVHSRLVETVAG